MVEIKVDKKAKKITMKTDYVFSSFKIEKYHEKFHCSFIKNSCNSMGCVLFFNKFGGRKYYPSEIEVKLVDSSLGEVFLIYS